MTQVMTELNPTTLTAAQIRQQIADIRAQLATTVETFPRGQALMITALNEKGGVGKSTLCLILLTALAQLGLRVLALDSSLQGNLTQSLGLEKAGGLYNLLIRGAKFDDVVQQVAPERIGYDVKGELWAVPGNIETRAIMILRPDVFVLQSRLPELAGEIDVVIADTGPEPSDIHNTLYMATDGILFPTQCSYLSMTGLADSILHKERAAEPRGRRSMSPIKTMGIIPTMYRMNTEAHDVGVQQLREEFKRLVWPPLPLRTVWEKASWTNESIFRFAPEDVAALEAWALTQRTLNALKEIA